MPLITSLNLPDHDDIYEAILRAQDGMTEAESAEFQTRLILILTNHIGDRDTLIEAIGLAKDI